MGAPSAVAVGRELPDVVELLILAAQAGLTVALAIDAVGESLDGVVAAGLREVTRRRASGESTAQALAWLLEQLGDEVRPLVTVLSHAERYGSPLVGPLERLAVEARDARRRRAEAAARRAPVLLVFPLVLCCLPAFALLTVVPLLLAALGSFRR